FPSPGSSFPVRSLRILHSTEFLQRFVSIPDDFSAFLPEAERRGFLALKEQAHLLIRQPRSHDSAHRLVRDLEPREDSELLLGASGLSAQMQPFAMHCMRFFTKLAEFRNLRHIAKFSIVDFSDLIVHLFAVFRGKLRVF